MRVKIKRVYQQVAGWIPTRVKERTEVHIWGDDCTLGRRRQRIQKKSLLGLATEALDVFLIFFYFLFY